MGLEYILRRVMAEAGGNSPELNSDDARAFFVDKINEAAQEIYEQKDLPVILKETFVHATADQQLALPAFVGELRAIREGSCCDDSDWYDRRWTLRDIRPRYTQAPWPNMWASWRIIGESPLMVELTNAAQGTVSVPVADPDLVVTILGSTATSNRSSDNITMTGTDVSWTKQFTDIQAIRKNKVTDYDVYILDAEGTEISVIYADQLEARSLIVDVSKYPSLGLCACEDGTYIMQVLYKPRLPRLENDEDAFPLTGYDNEIILKTKQLLCEDEEGKEQRALLMHQKVQNKLDNKIQDKTGTTQKNISFGRNPLFNTNRFFRC